MRPGCQVGRGLRTRHALRSARRGRRALPQAQCYSRHIPQTRRFKDCGPSPPRELGIPVRPFSFRPHGRDGHASLPKPKVCPRRNVDLAPKAGFPRGPILRPEPASPFGPPSKNAHRGGRLLKVMCARLSGDGGGRCSRPGPDQRGSARRRCWVRGQR
jgi:hypothetical protein